MIHIITGRSGSGKTEMLHQWIADQPEDKAVVFIVPEQSSFYNEKKILQRLGDRRAAHIEVLSFRRLCSNIFNEYRGLTGQRIDDGIKAILMSMAIENAPSEGGELELYARKGGLKKTIDLVEPMQIAVNEYKMCMISPEQLFTAAGKVESKVLASKLRDSARIYAAYNALLENSYEDPDDDLTRLYELLGEHNHFRGKTVLIDSFSGFSAQEMKIVSRIMTQADDLMIALCCDKQLMASEVTIFEESNRTYRELIRMAQKNGIPCRVTDCGDQGFRFRSPAIRALEESLFTGFRDGSSCEAAPNDGSVVMMETAGVYDEVNAVAQQIFHLVHEKGYCFQEIEVIARDIELYKNVIRSEFPKYGIPYFLSDSESLENKIFVRMLLSAFEVIQGSYDSEAILRLAKSGLTLVSEEEAFGLENYVYIWSIRGSRWKQPFTMSPDGMKTAGEPDEEEMRRIGELEATRQKLITPLCRFEEELHGAYDGAQITYALYHLIEALDCQRQFRRYIRQVQQKQGDQQAERESIVWDKVMAILDKLYSLMQGKRIDSRSYLELMRLYLRKTPVSDIPQTVNSVTVGIAGTIRSAEPRVVFAVGCNEGVFPAQPSAVGIFTDSERRLLREECPEEDRLPLYDSIFGNSLKEKFHVYTVLTAPSERLVTSWHTQSFSGKPCIPSVICSEVMAVLPDTEIIRRREMTADQLLTQRQSFDYCARSWRQNNEMTATLKLLFAQSEVYADRTAAIARCAEKTAFVLRDQERIRRLFGSPLRLSSTKLDQFASCKFAYFCRYGLEAYPIRKAVMDGGLYGSAMHFIFENVLREHPIEDFVELSEEELKAEIRTSLYTYVDNLGDQSERGSRFQAICTRIRRNAFKTLTRMQRQFRKDQFRPVDYELRIGTEDSGGIPAYELELPTGDRLLVSGFVDRVDTAELHGRQYLRIIDYKTGNDIFQLSNIANGVKLQMLLYLSAILKNGTKKYADGKMMLPAGVLYVPATARASVAVSGKKENLELLRSVEEKSLKMSGLLLNDKEVLELMEYDLAGEFIPASMTTKKELSAYSSVISDTDFEVLFRYIDVCLKTMGTELYTGNIAAYPEKHACDYCDYKSVCRFEEGDQQRELIRFRSEEALKYILDSQGEEEETDGSKQGV